MSRSNFILSNRSDYLIYKLVPASSLRVTNLDRYRHFPKKNKEKGKEKRRTVPIQGSYEEDVFPWKR